MNKRLDLHGIKLEDVERLLENFILLNELPLTIITGNSDYMKKILIEFCKKNNISYEQWPNSGKYIIFN